MKSRKTTIPDDSLTRRFPPADYADAFACGMAGESSPDEVLLSLWTGMPGWVDLLFRVRNALVRIVGLKGGGRKDRNDLLKKVLCGEENTKPVSVAARSECETVLKISDKHLDALMSVHIALPETDRTLTLTTLVYYHNRLGRIYFYAIRPFHKWVVMSMLKRTITKTNKQ